MPKLPVVSGREAVKRFQKLGYEVVRQRDSHIRMHHPKEAIRKPLTIPDHKELGHGLLRKLLRDARITVHKFEELK